MLYCFDSEFLFIVIDGFLYVSLPARGVRQRHGLMAVHPAARGGQ